jgi:hypothetical protein
MRIEKSGWVVLTFKRERGEGKKIFYELESLKLN